MEGTTADDKYCSAGRSTAGHTEEEEEEEDIDSYSERQCSIAWPRYRQMTVDDEWENRDARDRCSAAMTRFLFQPSCREQVAVRACIDGNQVSE